MLKNLFLTCFWLFVAYKSGKEIVDSEIAVYKNANKFEDSEAYEKGLNDYYQWALKNKK